MHKRKKALKLLQSSQFFTELLSALRKAGLVGEERNALSIYVTATSRLLDKPLCQFVKGPSSVGKNFLTDTVLGFLPATAVQELTSSSTRSWNYLGNKLAHKVVYVKERNETAGSVHPTRLLISEKGLVHYVTVKKNGRFVTERRVTKGPIAAISTTTSDRVEVDDETRHVSIWSDDTREQTLKIMVAAVEKQAGLSPSERAVWHEVQRIIGKRAAAVAVDLPEWFKDLVALVCADNLWARRYFPAFLQACRTVALIRSFSQKPQTTQKLKTVTVRFVDFAVSALIFNDVFGRSIDRADDHDLEIQQHVRHISFRKDGAGASANDLATELGISIDRAYSLLRKASVAGAICRANKPSKANRKLFLPTKPRPFLPDPAEVFKKLEGLPGYVRFVHPLTGKWVTYGRNNTEKD